MNNQGKKKKCLKLNKSAFSSSMELLNLIFCQSCQDDEVHRVITWVALPPTPSAIITAIKFYMIEIEIKGSIGLEKKLLVQIHEPGQEVCGSGAMLSNSALIMRLAAGALVTKNTSVSIEVTSAFKTRPTHPPPAANSAKALQAMNLMKVSATHWNDTAHKKPLPPKNSIFLWNR